MPSSLPCSACWCETGLDEDDTAADPFAKATPLLAGWAAASVQGLAASGVSMSPPRRLGTRRARPGLAVLIPRPRVNLLPYYGVLVPRATWRREIEPSTPGVGPRGEARPGVNRRRRASQMHVVPGPVSRARTTVAARGRLVAGGIVLSSRVHGG